MRSELFTKKSIAWLPSSSTLPSSVSEKSQPVRAVSSATEYVLSPPVHQRFSFA